MFIPSPFLQGLMIGLSLIVSIGAQNAFVIKQGLLQNNIFIISLICFLIDSILIIVGVMGLGGIIVHNPIVMNIAKYGCSLFLVCYAISSFKHIFDEEYMDVSCDNKKISYQEAIITTLAVSLLNTHLYLDTCVLIGSIGSQFESVSRFYFAGGAVLASFLWFFSIGFGARLLLPLFQKPISWKILDFLVGVMMCVVAAYLICD